LLWHHRAEDPDSDQWKQIIPVIEEEIRNGEVMLSFFRYFDALLKPGREQ
jgi:hypothetical protein